MGGKEGLSFGADVLAVDVDKRNFCRLSSLHCAGRVTRRGTSAMRREGSQ